MRLSVRSGSHSAHIRAPTGPAAGGTARAGTRPEAGRPGRTARAGRRPEEVRQVATVRLTVAQAVVRFLANQYSERDGVEQRLITGLLRDLRPRQRGRRRAGAAGGAHHRLGRPAVLPGPQRAGHGARGRRLRPHAQPAAGLGLHRVDRAGLDEHADRRRAGHHEPHPGAAAGQRHLRHPGRQPGAAGAGAARPGTTSRSTTRSGRCRRFFDRVWRPEQLPPPLLGGDAGAHRPGRDRCGDDRAAAGRAGRGARLARRSCSRSGSGTSRGRCPSPPRWPGRSRCSGPRAGR